MLSDPSGELFIKPCHQPEIDFYDSVTAHPDLVPHVPTYFGKISLGADTNAAQVAGAFVLPSETDPDPPIVHGVPGTMVVENAWAPSNGGKIHTDSAVVLENLSAHFKKPNILDVKLGSRLWANDAPIAKRVKLDKVAEETTSNPLGLRIEGMNIYQGALGNTVGNATSDGYRFYDKSYGRSLTTGTIVGGFEEYFQVGDGVKAKGPIRKVIRRFMENLRSMESALEKEESRMYSASLLFVYEGDQQTLEDAFVTERDIIATLTSRLSDGDDSTNGKGAATDDRATKGIDSTSGKHTADVNVGDRDGEEDAGEDEEGVKFPAIQSLKLIDFAHAEWTPGQGPDENILRGIRNTSKILAGLAG